MAEDDELRFEVLYRKHFRLVLRYALARLDQDRAMDVAAETFLIAWRRFRDVPPEPAPWLLGVARKVVAGQLRAQSRRDALVQRLSWTPGRPPAVCDPADEVAERASALAALASLTGADREVLKLIAWDGLPAPVAARVLGVSRLNFAVRLHRARRRLASALTVADSRLADAGPLAKGPPVLRPARQDSSHQAGRHVDARAN